MWLNIVSLCLIIQDKGLDKVTAIEDFNIHDIFHIRLLEEVAINSSLPTAPQLQVPRRGTNSSMKPKFFASTPDLKAVLLSRQVEAIS